jgi:hypothetical protein
MHISGQLICQWFRQMQLKEYMWLYAKKMVRTVEITVWADRLY